MKTAVEQLEKQILDNWMGILTGKVNIGDFFEQAKEMEKEQIMDAWNEGQSNGATICTPKYDNPSEEYYNETFKSK